jgi:hypothetical protein
MFESKERLARELRELLDSFRRVTEGRYACLLKPAGGVLFESPEPAGDAWVLRRLLEERSGAIFRLPGGLADEGPLEDAFEGWEEDEFFLAFINRRIALIVACPRAEAARESVGPLLKALTDRLFRYDETYRMDSQGRGFFFGRARLDIVVIGGTAQS